MTDININELKESYYEYAVKIPQGLEIIITLIAKNELEQAFQSIANLGEGLESLLMIEKALLKENLKVNSTIGEAVAIFKQINESLETQSLDQLHSIIKYQLIPLFSSSSEWTFENKI